jgi:DNA-binding SARP family transcriptional activator/predicted ATPase
MPAPRLTLFGGFTLRVGEVDVQLPRKTQGLIAHLALKEVGVSRERMAWLLWEGASDAQGRSSLRQALSGLRRELSSHGLDSQWTENDPLQLGEAMTCDVAEFRAAQKSHDAHQLQHACALYTGDLLLGFHVRSPQFDNWLQTEREHLRRQALDTVSRWHATAKETGDAGRALDALRRWITWDPLDERPRRELMQQLAAEGRPAQALEEYRLLRETLRRELGMNPEPATEALQAEILKRRATVPPATPSLASNLAPANVARSPAPELLREVTVLVVRLGALRATTTDSVSLDVEDEARFALELHALVKQECQVYGGNTAPGAAHDVLSAFGTQSTRGNEAEAAVRAALAIQAAVAASAWPPQIKSSLRLALAQGPAMLDPRGHFAGRPMSVASELLSDAAAGQLVAHSSVVLALAGRLLGTAWASGHWVVNGLGEHPDVANTSFVGRKAELALLCSHLSSCLEQRHGHVVIVRAEAGMGKTRLVGALREHALTLGVSCHSAHALDFGQASDSRLLAALTLGLLGLTPEASSEQRRAHVQTFTASQPELTQSVIHLLELVGAAIPSSQRSLQRALDPTSRASGRSLALARLLQSATSERGLLLLLEDLHWSTPEDRELLAALANNARALPVMVVVSTRTHGDPLDAAWRARLQGTAVSVLELGPLPLADARSFAARHHELQDDIVQSCIERAQGLPLFLDQLLRAAAAGQTQLPGSVRALIHARLDGLEQADRELAFAAAVLGQRGVVQALQFLVEREGLDFEPLARSGLLGLGRQEWWFAHALFRDAVYDSLLKGTRSALHARAAQWYQGRDPLLHADHLAAAGDANAASAYLALAGKESEADRTQHALHAAERARSLATDPETLLLALSALGQLQLASGAVLAALAAYREALTLVQAPRARAEAWLGIASALRVLDRYGEALEALDQARRGLPSEDAALQCKWWTVQGNVQFSLDFEACRAAHEHALNYARAAGSALDEVLAVGGLGDAYFQRGLMRTAHACFERCVEQCRNIGTWASLLAYLPMRALTRAYQGEWAQAEEDSREALELAEKVGSPRRTLLARVVASCLALYRAAYLDAEHHASQSLLLARQLGAARFEAEALGMIGAAQFRQGRRVEGLASVRQAVQLARGAHSAYAGPFVFGYLALATESAEEREQALEQGEQLLQQGAIGSNVMEFLAAASEVHLRARDWPRALRAAEQLELATAAEPTLWTDLVIRRVRMLVETEGASGSAREQRLLEFEKAARDAGFSTLIPELDFARG